MISTTTTDAIMSIFGCMHIIDYVFEYNHILDTLLMNCITKFPPSSSTGGGVSTGASKSGGELTINSFAGGSLEVEEEGEE